MPLHHLPDSADPQYSHDASRVTRGVSTHGRHEEADKAATSTQHAPTSPEHASLPRFGPARSGVLNVPDSFSFSECGANSRAGRPCGAPPRGGRPFCIFHDPEYREAHRQNASAAGRASGEARRARPIPIVPFDIGSAHSRSRLLGYLVSAELQGAISPGQSSHIIRALSVAARDSGNLPSDLLEEIQ